MSNESNASNTELIVSLGRKIAGLKGRLTTCINSASDSVAENAERRDIRKCQDYMEAAKAAVIDGIYELVSVLYNAGKEDDALRKESEIDEIERRVDYVNRDIRGYLNSATSNLNVDNSVKHGLEKLPLEKFSGNEDFFYWKSAFDACVGSQSFSDQIKMLRLLSCLSGEPKFLLKMYPPDGSAYKAAINRLESEYGGTRRLLQKTINNVRHGKVIHGDNINDMRAFLSTLEAAKISMDTYSLSAELEAGTLYECAKDRLHKPLLRRFLRWSMDNKKGDNFRSLLQYLTDEIKILSEVFRTGVCREEKKDNEYRVKKAFVTVSSGTENGKKERLKPVCLLHASRFQNDRHYLDECELFRNMSVSKRHEICREKGLCRLCLKTNHAAKDCRTRKNKPCGKNGCQSLHHAMLHQEERISCREVSSSPLDDSKMNGQASCMRTHGSLQGYVSTQTIPAVISNGNKRLKVNVFLDAGSNASFINEEVVDFLNINKGPREKLEVQMLNGKTQLMDTTRVSMTLESTTGEFKQKVSMFTSNKVTGKITTFDWNTVSAKWPHFRNISFPILSSKRLQHDVLIGTDLAFLHASLKELAAGVDAPVARLTPLGWTAMGPVEPGRIISSSMPSSFRINAQPMEVDHLIDIVKKSWELDGIGIISGEQLKKAACLSPDEEKATQILGRKLRYCDGKYEVPTLWKENHVTLSNNRDMAVKRDQALMKSLKQRPEVKQQYEETMANYEKKEYIQRVPTEDVYRSDCWYSPHFAVVKLDRQTTKVRIVFDCAATHLGSSLNKNILKGPKLQNNIVDVLLRFRRYEFALAGDISEMYLHIGLLPEDRRFCRFVWNNEDWEWTRELFGKTDSPFVALYVLQTHAKKYSESFPLASETIMHSMYVDDALDSCPSIQEAKNLQTQLSFILSEAGMTMRKWMSNSSCVVSEIPEEQRASQMILNQDVPLPVTKTLGLLWNADKDVFLFRNDISKETKINWTKRDVIKMFSKVFDPLGFLTPVLNYAKVLFQRTWTRGLSWDDPIPDDLAVEWEAWRKDIERLSEISVPRYLGLKPKTDFEIHVFSDASTEAYAAVAYVRVIMDQRVQTEFIISKARVSPLKAHSIPRLELIGATIATRMAEHVCQVLKFNLLNVVFWTDSMNVLYWIKRPSKMFSTFVSNRCGEIQEKTTGSQWRYCPTSQNPADIATRKITVTDIEKKTIWWKGPDFLLQNEDCWPNQKVEVPLESIREETSKRYPVFTTVIVDRKFPLHPSRWSNWSNLRHRTAYVCRFIQNCKLPRELRIGRLEPINSELKAAENKLISLCQKEQFYEEIESLLRNEAVSKGSSLKKMNPFLDDNEMLRSRTRLENVDWLPVDTRLPIILPKKHDVTHLLVKEAHERVGHTIGVNATITELTKRFWIPHVRKVVGNQMRRCSICIKNKAKPAEQQMAPIPSFRLSQPLRAFSKVGLDFAGPFLTKAGRGKPRFKRYICLFTCLQTRAVHLEMTFSLDTDSFLSALSRMTDRRGIPLEVISDNGGSFVRAEIELRNLVEKINKQRVENKTTYGWKGSEGIIWHFNPPCAPHFGGVFERMVRSAKRALNCILNDADINDEELLTAITGVEYLLNSRPLTPPSTDSDDLSPLTPNHFLFGMVGGQLTPDDVTTHPTRRWKTVNRLITMFWRRWQKELLPLQQPRTKWSEKRMNMEENDIVIIVDPDLPRGQWRLGRIVKVFPGKDGRVRVADVICGGRTYRRPVTRLCVLEFKKF